MEQWFFFSRFNFKLQISLLRKHHSFKRMSLTTSFLPGLILILKKDLRPKNSLKHSALYHEKPFLTWQGRARAIEICGIYYHLPHLEIWVYSHVSGKECHNYSVHLAFYAGLTSMAVGIILTYFWWWWWWWWWLQHGAYFCWWHCSGQFLFAFSFNPQNNPMMGVLTLGPFADGFWLNSC